MSTLQPRSSQILLVEDDPGVRQGLTELIEQAGYTVAPVADGVQALAYLQDCDQLPTLILLDLMTPRMNGFEFRLRQQAKPHLQRIPTVALSAYAYRQSQQLPLNVTALLPKPVNIDQLLQLIERYCAFNVEGGGLAPALGSESAEGEGRQVVPFGGTSSI